jgi:F420-0:gamma-glutamyl ligase
MSSDEDYQYRPVDITTYQVADQFCSTARLVKGHDE